MGENEIEVDSRDFYVDNNTLQEIIENVSKILRKNQPRILPSNNQTVQASQYGLESLDDAEAFEPEFSDPKPITFGEIKSKLHLLETTGFFNLPRSASETVQQLREHGWAANQFDVAKTLAKMASNREIHKNSQENRTRYFAQQIITSN